MFLQFTLKKNIQNFFVLVHFVCHTPQIEMFVFAFQSEVWIAQNFNFTVFEDFCLSSIFTKCKPRLSSLQNQQVLQISR